MMPIAVPWIGFVSLRTTLQMLGVPLPQVDNGWACEFVGYVLQLTTVRMMYPITTTALLGVVSWRVISSVLTRVRQWMIDAEYVVEERVENYEPDNYEHPAEAEWAHQLLDPVYVVEDGPEVPGNAEPEDEWEDVVVLE